MNINTALSIKYFFTPVSSRSIKEPEVNVVLYNSTRRNYYNPVKKKKKKKSDIYIYTHTDTIVERRCPTSRPHRVEISFFKCLHSPSRFAESTEIKRDLIG